MQMRCSSLSPLYSSSYSLRSRNAPNPPVTASSKALSYASSALESTSVARKRPLHVSASDSYSFSLGTYSTVMRFDR